MSNVKTNVKKKIFVKSFGCQMNQYDSSRVIDLMISSGEYENTDNMKEAQLIIFNTCSVREKAEQRLLDELGRVRVLRKERNDILVAIGGCVASQEGDKLLRQNRGIDLIFGPQTLHRLPEMIQKRMETGQSQIDINFPAIEKFDCLPLPGIRGLSAYLSIMEGCSKYCTYCIVPFTRGEEISRPLNSILQEARHLLEQGVKEIVLLGQNVNAYQGQDQSGDCIDFSELLSHLEILSGLKRIRYTTSHPKEMTRNLIECYEVFHKVVSHVHLPIQSGSDKILTAMKRGHTVLEYKSIIRRLRQARPDISISTDIIVGFPGETERDFQSTLEIAEEIGFDHSYSFKFSKRPGTVAAQLLDQIPEDIKSERLYRLQNVLRKSAFEITEKMLHSTQKIMIDQIKSSSKVEESYISGMTDNNRRVRIHNVSDMPDLGNIVSARIEKLESRYLSGVLVSSV